jgi:hypothetical protein
MPLAPPARFSTPPVVDRAVALWIRLTAPRPDNLPNALVLLWFPILVVLGVVVLSALSLSGTSSGEWTNRLALGPDHNLLAGQPRPIRGDEWYVQSSWVVSQVDLGLPTTNPVFPGGMDATVFNDLPSKDWSTLFRPHLWALMMFPLDQGMAARWWVPGALVLIAVYCFVVSVLPRSSLLGVALAFTLLWQPSVQWWWLPVTLLPLAFAFAAMTAVVWCVRSDRLAGPILWSVVTGYLAVTMVMSIYVPYMVGSILAAAAFGIGYLVHAGRTKERSPRVLLRRLVPLGVAACGAGLVSLAWVLTRRDTISAVLGTVYPGQRTVPPGESGRADLVDLLSAPFQRSLQLPLEWGLAGGSQSESSSPLLLGLFLAVPLGGVLISTWRRHRRVDWLVSAVLAVQAITLAYLFVPGWGPVARLLLLDRSSPQRLRSVFAIMAVVSIVVLADRLRSSGWKVPWSAAVVGGGTALLASAFVWRELDASGSPLVPSLYALSITALLAAAVVLVSRRLVTMGAVLVLICSAVIGVGVNPLYRGVVDLRNDSEAGRAVHRIAERDPDAAWVGVGSLLSTATLMQTGTYGYSGIQTYPPTLMWDRIDPQHRYEQVWNRLAHVNWEAGSGPPRPRTTYADQIFLTFDACDDFAQKYVTYVLVDGPPLRQKCLTRIDAIATGGLRQWIYRVKKVPASTSASEGRDDQDVLAEDSSED